MITFNEKGRTHPSKYANALLELRRKHGFDGDLGSDNLGKATVTDPTTGKKTKRLIIRDAGYTKRVQQRHYR